MEQRSHVDLINYSYDEFVAFLFDRDVPDESEKKDSWDWHIDVEFDAKKVCAYYVRLFRKPEFLLTRFTKPQLEQGFWAIQGPNLDCSVTRIILESDLPLALREECIRSMVDLFKHLFAKESLDTAVSMWWDSLCYDWHCGNRDRERGGEDERLQDVFFETLSTLLSFDSENCQGAALHGLGHLHHPDTPKIIEQYLHEHSKLTKEWRAYALSAAKFKVM
jgi:hypothetical protein